MGKLLSNRRRFLKTAAGIFVPAVTGLVRSQPFTLNDPAFLAATRPKASTFTYYATKFSSAATAYLLRGSDLTGNADSTKGTISVWFKPISDTTGRGIMSCVPSAPPYGEFDVWLNNSNKLRIEGWYNPGGSICLNWTSTGTYLEGSGWHHLLASWDLAATTFVAYVDDSAEAAAATATNHAVGYTGSDFWVANAKQVSKFQGSLCEVWFHNNAYYDFSVASNRRLFDNGSGKPVAPPAGAIIYLHDPYTSFTNNSGSGGNFTATGAALTGDTPP